MGRTFITYTFPILLFSVIWSAVEFLVPVRYSEANISVGMIAILFSVSSAISLILDIPAGKLSDRIGREKMIMYSMIIAIAALALIYFFSNVWIFIICSILVGIAYGLNWSPLIAFVGDRSEADGKHGSVFGDFFVLNSLGEAAAPLALAVLVFHTSSAFPFIVLSGAALICALIFMKLAKRTRASAEKTPLIEHFSYRSSLRVIRKSGRTGIFLLVIGFFVAFFWQSVWFTQPLIGFYEHSLFDSALIIAAFSLPDLLFAKPIGALIDRVGEKRICFWSIAGIIASFACFYLSATLAGKIISIFAAATAVLGIWLVMDVIAVKAAAKEDRGEFFGILETVRDTSYAATPLFIGAVYRTIGLDGISLANALFAVLLLGGAVWMFKKPAPNE